MTKHLSLAAAGLLAVAVAPCTAGAQAQPQVRRFEVGAQMTRFGFSTCYYVSGCYQAPPPSVALGPQVTWNATRNLAIDATYSVIARNDGEPNTYAEGTVAGGRGTRVLVGPRLETRGRHFGIFVHAETGLLYWTNAPQAYMLNTVTPGDTQVREVDGGRSFFVVGAGVGAEYTPADRVHLRVGVGDVVTDYRRVRYDGFTVIGPTPTAWNGTADLTLGLSYGLGHELLPRDAARASGLPHRFADRTNLILIAASAAAGAADGVTTQRFIARNFQENDAIARPLVDQGWVGQVAISLIVDTAGIAAMYGLHRTGHHWLERLLPIAATLPSARNAYLNARDY